MIRQPRTVSMGARGPDVVAYKGGLVHAGARPKGLSRSPLFGARMRHEVVFFQRHHGLVRDGIIGPHTYKLLYPHMGAYARALLKHANDRYQERSVRDRVVQNALWQPWLSPYFVYAQVRPWPVEHPFRTISSAHPVVTDCSGFVGMIARWSHAPTPFPSFGWDGEGNTDTMVQELRRISFPDPGDLILYDNPGHVVIVVRYPYAVSFGSEPGPHKIDSRYRTANHYRSFL
jgi:hypothetical protein